MLSEMHGETIPRDPTLQCSAVELTLCGPAVARTMLGRRGEDGSSVMTEPKVSRASSPQCPASLPGRAQAQGLAQAEGHSGPLPYLCLGWLWVLVPHQELCLSESEPEAQVKIPALEHGRPLRFHPNSHWGTFLCQTPCWQLPHRIS